MMTKMVGKIKRAVSSLHETAIVVMYIHLSNKKNYLDSSIHHDLIRKASTATSYTVKSTYGLATYYY